MTKNRVWDTPISCQNAKTLQQKTAKHFNSWWTDPLVREHNLLGSTPVQRTGWILLRHLVLKNILLYGQRFCTFCSRNSSYDYDIPVSMNLFEKKSQEKLSREGTTFQFQWVFSHCFQPEANATQENEHHFSKQTNDLKWEKSMNMLIRQKQLNVKCFWDRWKVIVCQKVPNKSWQQWHGARSCAQTQ